MIFTIINASVFTGDEVLTNRNIVIKNGIIEGFAQAVPEDSRVIDVKGKNISPGFIDIQINGGKQRYFSQNPDGETLDDIYKSCCEYGTPYILPTLISSPINVILEAIEAIKAYRKKQPGVLGMHLEGPYFNPEKRGAHNPAIIRKPTDDELQLIIEKGRDVIKLMTIAPEMFSDSQLEMLLESGIVLSAGHTMMSYEQAQECFAKGIRLVTHLYNAMTQFGHRECGLVGAVFDNENIFAPIVLDGGHCHYAAARFAFRQKKNKLFLISDASFLGREKMEFDWEGLNIKMVDGYYRDKNGSLAGAAISMPEAMRNAIQHLGASLQEVVEMATSRPAEAIKMELQVGFIKPGYPAVFSVFDDELKEVELLKL